MDQNGESQDGAAAPRTEELPQMDGSCDACEPDEAQPATHVCHSCGFAFCPVHADRHASSTHHPLMPYNHEEAQAHRAAPRRDSREAEGRAAGDEAMAPLGAAMANAHLCDDGGGKAGAEDGGQLEAERGDGAEGDGAEGDGAEGGEAAAEPGRRDTVTVERLRCKIHGQEGSLYCKPDEKIICVVCAVQGEHRDHEIITLREAYVFQKSKHGRDLLACTQQMAEKIKTKWTNPEMSTAELEAYVNRQFDELHRLVRLEEKRTLHLVDLKEAFLTASAAEKIAEISVETERLQEEMANITDQLNMLEQAEAAGPAGLSRALMAAPGPPPRVQHDIEARPRMPVPRANPMDLQDLDDNDSGPPMDHAP